MAETSPNGCTHCGIEARDHANRWTQAAGWHRWTPPTDAQRLERMRARKAETPPAPPAASAPGRPPAPTETPAQPNPGVSGP